MPIYEYICQSCDHEFEALLRSSSARATCPECGSKKLERKFSTFAAHGGGGQLPCADGSCCQAMPGGGCPGGSCPML